MISIKKIPSVLLLINGFHPKIGGAEKQVEMLARAFINKGCRVKVITLKFRKELKENDEVNGIPVKRISYPFIPILGTLVYMVKLFIYLFRTRNEWDAYYVVIVEYMALAASIAGHIWKKPVVLKFTGIGNLGVGYIKEIKLSGIIEWALKKADAYVAVSSEMEHEIGSYGFPVDKVHYLPNGVDCTSFKPSSVNKKKDVRQELNIKDIFTVVYTGRFVPVKDIPTLLRAWYLFINRGATAQLVLIGDGKLFDETKGLAEEFGIMDSTYFLGKSNDIDRIYKAVDMGVISSVSEGLSNVLLEMMAGGILVAATNIEGNSLVIEDQVNGLLFNPGDDKGLSEIMYDAYSNYYKYNSLIDAARDKVVSEYSIESLADAYINLFVEINETKNRIYDGN